LRPTSAGRPYDPSFAALAARPGVAAAYKWLLLAPEPRADWSLIARAVGLGLVPKTRAFTAFKLEQAIVRAARRRPPNGVELCGLGELGAASHADIRRALNRTRTGRGARVKRSLDVARLSLSLQSAKHSPLIRESLPHDDFDGRALQRAAQLLDQGWLAGGGAYGFKCAAQFALDQDPVGAVRWLDECWTVETARAIVAVVVSALSSSCKPRAVLIDALLRCRRADIRSLAVVWLSENRGLAGVQDVFARLLAAGWCVETAHWVSALPLHDLKVRRHRLTERIEVNRTARGRIVCLAGQLDAGWNDLCAEKETVEADWSAALSGLKAIWPTGSIKREAVDGWTYILGDDLPLWAGMAEGLPTGPARTQWLDVVLGRFKTQLGLDRGKPFTERQRADWVTAADSASAALCLSLDAVDRNLNPGRQAGLLVNRAVRAAAAWLDRPYSAGRDPEAWREAGTRLALALRFVFDVIGVVTPDRQCELAQLKHLVLDETERVLARVEAAGRPNIHIDDIALRAVFMMVVSPDFDRRAEWSDRADLGDFARALGRWSDPEAVARRPEVSAGLFRVGVARRLAEFRGERAARLLALTDLGAAAVRTSGDRDVAGLVDGLARSSASAPDISEAVRAQIEILLAAGRHGSEAERTVREDPSFRGRMMHVLV
jgi:hypothetical protein